MLARPVPDRLHANRHRVATVLWRAVHVFLDESRHPAGPVTRPWRVVCLIRCDCSATISDCRTGSSGA